MQRLRISDMTAYGYIKEGCNFVRRHKIACTLVAFVIWMLLFDQYSIVEQYKISQKISSYSKEKQYYINKIYSDSVMYNELQTNDNNLEKYAREQYYMKANDEDVFVIVEKD